MSQTPQASFWTNVAASVLASVIVFFLVWVFGLLNVLWSLLTDLWQWLAVPVVTTRLLFGFLWLVLISVVVGGLVAALTRWMAAKEADPYRTYTEDNFFGILWRWGWAADRVEILNLTPCCEKCRRRMWQNEVTLLNDHVVTEFRCQFCNTPVSRSGPYRRIEAEVEIEIAHKLDTEAWKEKAKTAQLRKTV